MNDPQFALRRLPQVQRLLEMAAAEDLCREYGRTAVTNALRSVLADARREIQTGVGSDTPDADALLLCAGARLLAQREPALRHVINATGIILHTNLGRAPIAAEAAAAAADVAVGYSNLEFDLATGRRGSRMQGVGALLKDVTGAEAGLAVNNGAAALLLALSALSGAGEVIVSRGELVEIGGGFRIPDIIQQGGARLIEVGTTNRTRIADYQNAVGPDTRILLKVHQSNFRMVGFTCETPITELAELARQHDLLVVADLGSGLIHDIPNMPEPTIRSALAAGANVVTCSGDKLLGGPQAGLIAGSKDAIDRLHKHPLLRALRLDKMTLAALETTLMLHRDNPSRVPVVRMLTEGQCERRARAEQLQTLLGGGDVEATDGFAGGGSLPEERIESFALVLRPSAGAESVAVRLRETAPAIIGRIRGQCLILDMLAVTSEELPQLATALRSVLE